jgi:hypothetical protein
MNAYAGQSIVLTRAVLDGGINDVLEWSVYRKKVGEAYALIDTYNLVTEGHYVPPDDEIEGSVGTFSFGYSTQIPETAIEDDEFQYRFVSTGRPTVERESAVYTIIVQNELKEACSINGIMVAI